MPRRNEATLKTTNNEAAFKKAEDIEIEGIKFGSNFTEARKLRDLDTDKIYVLESINEKATKFGSYIVECSDNKTYETFLLFMPRYILDNGKVGLKFSYKGLQSKSDNSGHEYHRVLWEKKYLF